jgi:predicted O-methyltransferase YrrM
MKDKLYEMRNSHYAQGLLHLIDAINSLRPTKEMTMIEIGSYAGESTEIFAQHFQYVIAIDPYNENYDPNDVTCSYAPLSDVLKSYEERMRKYDNVSLLQATSDDAVKLVTLKADFVYIDGLHTYDQVKKDIENYLPLINKNGFIGGHDYHPVYQGVMDAIVETIGYPHKTFQDTSWLFKL